MEYTVRAELAVREWILSFFVLGLACRSSRDVHPMLILLLSSICMVVSYRRQADRDRNRHRAQEELPQRDNIILRARIATMNQ